MVCGLNWADTINLGAGCFSMSHNLDLRIGEISISITGDAQTNIWEVPPAYHPFAKTGKTDIALRLLRGVPPNGYGEKRFDCKPVWTLYRRDDTSVIEFFDTLAGLKRILVFPRDLRMAQLYFPDESDRFIDPFHGPTLELLMVNCLARGKGIVIHGCGVKHNDRGLLFVGESGAGKTTTAKMWSRQDGVEILSDDRTIVRKKGDHFVMYGTPWHGEGKFGSPHSAKLDQIFFIKHGTHHSTEDISNVVAVTQFLKSSFPPFWDAEGMDFSIAFLNELAAKVSCQELIFKPDRSVIEFIQKAKGTGHKALSQSA